MVCVPAASVVVEKVAGVTVEPLTAMVPVPIEVPPSRKVTVPVGEPAAAETFAVKVTVAPAFAVRADEVTVVVVATAGAKSAAAASAMA